MSLPGNRTVQKYRRKLQAAARERVADVRIKHVSGPTDPALGPFDVVALCLARNSRIYMRSFMTHHLDLGIRHVVLVDNDSDDDTAEIAASYPNVTVLHTSLDWEKYQHAIRRYLWRRYAKNRWALFVDADELFDYPCSRKLSLPGLIGYLNRHGYTAVLTSMLDMVSGRAIGQDPLDPDQDLKHEYPFCDMSSIKAYPYTGELRRSNTISNEALMLHKGGIRETVFGKPPYLFKHSLSLNDGKTTPVGAHRIRNAHIADISSIVFHYKLAGDWHNRIRSTRSEVKAALENPELRLVTPNTKRLTGIDELIERGFVKVSDQYMKVVERRADPET